MENCNYIDKEKNDKIYNIIYGSEFILSEYTNIFREQNLLNDNFCKEITSLLCKNDESEIYYYISLLNKKYKCFYINKTSPISIFFSNYINRNVFNKVEKFYGLIDYSLTITSMMHVNLLEIEYDVELEKKNFDFYEKNIPYNKTKGDFIMIYSLDDFENKIIHFSDFPSFENILEKNSIFLFCKKMKFNFNSCNKNILLCTLNIYSGYNKFDYNSHPNQFK
jgi:hypothetical protein